VPYTGREHSTGRITSPAANMGNLGHRLGPAQSPLAVAGLWPSGRQVAAHLEIVESGHFLLRSSADEQTSPHYL
jgi:hypothetical protein